MELSSPTLHPDIWYAIMGFLNKHDLERFSSASHQFRSLALPKLFRSIYLRLGVMDDDDSVDEKRRARFSTVVLRKIADPFFDGTAFDFAHLVRELRITWVCRSRGFSEDKDHLRLALRRLRGLRHFIWIGFRLPVDVADEISSPAITKSLQVDSVGEVFAHDLGKLTHLWSIESVYDCKTRVWSPTAESYAYAAFYHVLRRNQETLKRLSVGGDVMRKICPHLTGITANLTNLAINEVYDLPELGTLLLEASNLEALTLLNAKSLDCLPCAADTLPRLQFLKIYMKRPWGQSEDDDEAETVANKRAIAKHLLKFSCFHGNLSGFDFWCPSCLEDEEVLSDGDDYILAPHPAWFFDVIEAVCALEHLRALGLTIPELAEVRTRESLGRITQHTALKHSCVALRLGGMSNVPMEDWTTEFQNCSFISLSCGRPGENTFATHRIPSIEELVLLHSSCPLEQFCLDGQMYDITPAGADSGPDTIKPWSLTRANWRSERDFCTSEAYWLMQYRTIREGYEAASD